MRTCVLGIWCAVVVVICKPSGARQGTLVGMHVSAQQAHVPKHALACEQPKGKQMRTCVTAAAASPREVGLGIEVGVVLAAAGMGGTCEPH